MKFKTRKIYFYDDGDVMGAIKGQIEGLTAQIEELKNKEDEGLKSIIEALTQTVSGLKEDLKRAMEVKKEESKKEEKREPKKEEKKIDDSEEMPLWYRKELDRQKQEAFNKIRDRIALEFPEYKEEIEATKGESELNRLVNTIKKVKEKESEMTDEKLLKMIKEKGEDWQNQNNLSYKKKEKQNKDEKVKSFFDRFNK